jgi:hypothetical protein
MLGKQSMNYGNANFYQVRFELLLAHSVVDVVEPVVAKGRTFGAHLIVVASRE